MLDISLLDGCPLFYELFDKEIAKVVKDADVHSYEDGDFIIEDGEEGEEIFILLEGTVKVTKKNAEGEVKTLVTLQKGAVFGEMVLIDEKVRAANIVAVDAAQVLVISFNQILELYEKQPKIFGILLLNLSRMVAERLRHANEVIKQLTQT